ncbi:MAG: biotin--[acetyl-CoA-carboxylase] ligase [Bacillota bacterium]
MRYPKTQLPDPKAIGAQLRTRFLGRNIVYTPETGSTNEDAKALGGRHPEGTVFLSAVQIGGKGRLGRAWSSPPGGIYMSLTLRPDPVPPSIPVVSIVAGYAVTRAIREVTGLAAALKWPNDVLVQGKKVCGILCEMVLPPSPPEPLPAPAPLAAPSSHERPAAPTPLAPSALPERPTPSPTDHRPLLVVGIGINACIDPSSLPPEVRVTACSLTSLLGDAVNASTLAAAVLNHFEPAYLQFLEDGLSPFLQGIHEVAAFLGQPVVIGNRSMGDKDSVQGVFREIDAQGRAIIEVSGGKRIALSAGDLSLRRT